MQAGLLKETIEVLTPDVSINEVGEQVTTYTPKISIRAHAVSNRKTRTNDNGDMWMPSTRTIEVRIFNDIEDYDIIRWGGKDYRILSIEIDRTLQCKRIEISQIND